MKALSVKPNYAHEIMTEQKIFEYRSWDTRHRGDLLICSTARKLKGFIAGHALCVVNLRDTRKLSDGTFAWVLDDVRLIKPFKVKGQLRLFEVDDSLIKYPEKSDVIIENGIEIISDEFFETYYEPLFA